MVGLSGARGGSGRKDPLSRRRVWDRRGRVCRHSRGKTRGGRVGVSRSLRGLFGGLPKP